MTDVLGPAQNRPHDGEVQAITMRELGKLTGEQVGRLDHPVPVTNNGLPVAWLVPLTPAERRRVEMVAAGRLRPASLQPRPRRAPLPPVEDGPSLSELLLEMREHERT
ncbi:hypothetical protein [Amycolatopsis nigrescens]|uniref:hypothetical protein n=1 Tax=Amycolatopsis nigrescens TaxID=381445 RepID=UPI000367BAD7|nr:hypothetical protein [Amycolatopsis nigrescens]